MEMQKLLELRLNNFVNEVVCKVNDFEPVEVNSIKTYNFLYACSNVNILQVVAKLTQLCLLHNVDIQTIIDSLEGSTEDE